MAANRDEFLSRPTAPLSRWGEKNDIIAGKDLEAGGTWLGVNSAGCFAALTNYRAPLEKGQTFSCSRGEIVQNFLAEECTPDRYSQRLRSSNEVYRGYNLIYGNRHNISYYSNQTKCVTTLAPGVYGLSNHLLDTDWPKVTRGKTFLKAALDDGEVEVEELFRFLEDRYQPPDEKLPDTGVGLEWERMLAPIFIAGSGYATRSSAVVLVRTNGVTEFYERTFIYDSQGRKTGKDKKIIVTIDDA